LNVNYVETCFYSLYVWIRGVVSKENFNLELLDFLIVWVKSS